MKKTLLLAMACLTMFVAFSQDRKEKAPKSKADSVAVPKSYTCPMHPAVVSDKPSKCPECGMALIEKIKYVCPMHPEVVADKPGKCLKCGMQLKIMSPEPKHKHTDSTHKM